jgi:hypothetical protein
VLTKPEIVREVHSKYIVADSNTPHIPGKMPRCLIPPLSVRGFSGPTV